MKERIFERMKEYGWNLEDFNKTYNEHYYYAQDLYDYFVKTEDINESRNLKDINEQKLYDMVGFVSDFLRALNEINETDQIKLELIKNHISNRGISYEEIGEELLAIANNNEQELEDLQEKIKLQIEELNRKVEVCGFNSQDMQEIEYLQDEHNKISKMLEEV